MLSRTAANLFWIARYIERAETNARLLGVGARNALVPNTGAGFRNEWESILNATSSLPAFQAKYGEAVQRNVESFMFFDRDNPSSIASCLYNARENGRIVRTALTGQVWDALNTTYQDLLRMERTERSQLPLNDLIEWTTRVTTLIRGASMATQLRNDGFDFTNIGHFVERADSTARLLDVKYYTLLPQPTMVGSGLDNYQWTMLLQAMSSQRAFFWAYGGEISAEKIAHFLILNPQSPRSLLTAIEGAERHLSHLSRAYGKSSRAQRKVRDILGELAEASVDDIFDEGLHEFLRRFIGEVAELGQAVQDCYLSGETR